MREKVTDAHAQITARMQAAGMYGLLSEVLGSGALRQHYGTDTDLIDRVKQALADYERLHLAGAELTQAHQASRLQSVAESIASIEEDGDTMTIQATLASHSGAGSA